ncbi:MAG: hypothetical protein WBW74_14160 [Xanthobacteraceae bacterium]
MTGRTLLRSSVFVLTGFLILVLTGHLWDRYAQETETLGFSGVYERYLASRAGFPGDPNAYRAAAEAEHAQQADGRETAALEE